MKRVSLVFLRLMSLCLLGQVAAYAQMVEYSGPPDALDHERFIHVVSETQAPVMPTYIKSPDGVYTAAAIRKPPGNGPFPAIIMFHGAPGGRGMEQLTGWSRGDHGGPVWERFLQEGFVVAVADYRGGGFDQVNSPSEELTTAIDDGIAGVDYIRALPYVDPAQVSVYGVSLGGNLVMFLASKIPDLKAVVVGAPAPIWFLGVTSTPGFAVDVDWAEVIDPVAASANIAPIETPLLIQVGTADFLLDLVYVLHDQLVAGNKQVRMEIYEHGYHDFVLGPQGHTRPDLPEGEKLMQGTLDALERSLAFIKSGRL
jgi:dipeptidyl aminopeptidase/acylaminoacyl peptidase